MTDLKTLRALGLLIFLNLIGLTNFATAQGLPAPVDHCLVSANQHFKELPEPSKFLPASYPALQTCVSGETSVIDIQHARAGKAKSLSIELTLRNGKLVESIARTEGEKNFKKLYKQVSRQAGKPTKMVASHGNCSYTWDLGSKISGNVIMLWNPETEKAEFKISQ